MFSRFVRLNEPVDEAFIYLAVSSAHGLPVKTENDELRHFGYSDLVRWFVESAKDSGPNPHTTWARESLRNTKVADILGAHPTEAVATLPHTSNLWDAVKLLVESGAHRVFVQENGVLVGVVSPSMIAQFLLDNQSKIEPHQLSEKLGQLGLTRHRATFAVNESSSLFEGFKYLAGEKITGCAVMRGENVVGCISVSDVRLVFEHGGAMLSKTCAEIVALERKEHFAPSAVVTITPDHTLLALLNRFCEKHVSRVFLTEHGQKPVATITFSDLMRAISKEGFVDPTLLWGF